MKISRRFLQSGPLQALLTWLLSLYIRLMLATTRWEVDWPVAVRELVAQRQPTIGAFWHGRLLQIIPAWPRDRALHVLISRHRDGILISRTVAHMGMDTIAGSPKRGGADALRQIGQRLKDGAIIGITPDGPRGPRMRAKPGAVKAAQLSGAPIVPLTGATTRRRLLGSWDRFHLSGLFGRGVVLLGEPIYVPADATPETLEECRLLLERRLNDLTAEADRRCGHEPVLPDAAPEPEAPEAEAHAGA